jgi:hypothetical protein
VDPRFIGLPIYESDNCQRLTQNFIENPPAEPDLHVTRVGYLEFKGRFKSRLDEKHAKYLIDNDYRETLGTYDACVMDGLRRSGVKRQVGDAVKKLVNDAYGEEYDVDTELAFDNPSCATDRRDTQDGAPWILTEAASNSNGTSQNFLCQEDDWA